MKRLITSFCEYTSRWLMIAMMLISFSESALALSQPYQIEYVKNNVSAAGLRKGTVVGAIYLVSQELEILSATHYADQYIGSMYMGPLPTKYTPDPGCVPDGDNSIGLLRYTGRETETVCNTYTGNYFISNVGAIYTGNTDISNGTLLYVYRMTVPRTKLADVVINDPAKALSHAGQNLVLSGVNLPLLQFSTVLDTRFQYSNAASDVSVHIGETPPVVFFPQQNTSNASLPLPVRPAGDSKNAMASGSASIDLCLYDGAGLSKSRYGLTFLDENTTNTSRDFGVYREGGAGRIAYKVSLTDPAGNPQEVHNREAFYWSNMQSGGAARSRLRNVQLPGMQGTVLCVPSTVTLKVSPVPYSSLAAGRYMGKVSILFTASTG